MIEVQSYPELYTTVIGWLEYNNLWFMLKETGLVLLPFIAIVVRNFIGPFLNSEALGGGPAMSQKKMEVNIVIAIGVVSLALQPWKALEISDDITFQPLCSITGETTEEVAKIGSTGTHFDEVITTLGQSVEVPLAWWAVMGISQGVTSWVKSGITCKPNLRSIKVEMNSKNVSDPLLRSEMVDFARSCWVPSWRKMQRENPSIPADMDEDELAWLGSGFFLSTPGYYDKFFSPVPIAGFEDSATNAGWEVAGTGVRPNCRDWWTDEEAGLVPRIKDDLGEGFFQKIGFLTPFFPSSWGGFDPVKDVLKRITGSAIMVAVNETAMDVSDRSYQPRTDQNAQFSMLWHGLSTVGAWAEAPTYFPKMLMLIDSLPLIQSVVLMGMYIMLALAIPIARYSFASVVTMTFAIFSVIFWHYWWAVAEMLDNYFIAALSPPTIGYYDLHYVVQAVALGAYIGLPLLWSTVMSWMGVQVGSGLQQALVSGGPAGNGGGKGASASTKGAQVVLGLAKKVISRGRS